MISRDKKIHNKQQLSATGAMLLATILGLIIRGFYVFQSNFPLEDGGMFLTMVKDLQAAHYHLPAVTSYNLSNIPYAYPPLPFYLTAALNAWLKIDLISLLRFLPLIFSVATIPAFYWLARQLLKNDTQVIAATFIFTLFSPVYKWQIMGGGLTRSPALFFTVLSLAAFLVWQKSGKWRALTTLVIFSSLTTLCHLEMVVILVLSYLVLYLLRKPTWKNFLQLVIAGIGTIALTAPWWGTVVAQHGLSPFINASTYGNFNFPSTIAYLLGLIPTSDLNEVLFTAIGLVGAVILAFRKDWLLAAWWLVLVLFDPRSTQRSVTIPIALLAGVAISEAVLWLEKNLPEKRSKATEALAEEEHSQNRPVQILILFCLFFAFFTDLVVNYTDPQYMTSINKENRAAMEWAKQNTPSESQFMVISYPESWAEDIVSEWFPTLAERRNLLTGQGQEWMAHGTQRATVKSLSVVSNCRMVGLDCFEKWLQTSDFKVDYFYFTTNSVDDKSDSFLYSSVVEAQMARDPNFKLVYSNRNVEIFSRK
jgi:hypothetical protein